MYLTCTRFGIPPSLMEAKVVNSFLLVNEHFQQLHMISAGVNTNLTPPRIDTHYERITHT